MNDGTQRRKLYFLGMLQYKKLAITFHTQITSFSKWGRFWSLLVHFSAMFFFASGVISSNGTSPLIQESLRKSFKVNILYVVLRRVEQDECFILFNILIGKYFFYCKAMNNGRFFIIQKHNTSGGLWVKFDPLEDALKWFNLCTRIMRLSPVFCHTNEKTYWK